MSQAYPDFLCHYYSAATGPFVNLSDLPLQEIEAQVWDDGPLKPYLEIG